MGQAHAAIFLLGLFAVSCNQDPIFYTISTEPAPIKPLIEGGPTNMAVFNREYPAPDHPELTKSVPILYVASGGLHWYAKSEKGTGNSQWDLDEYKIDQPGGKIISIAATPERLYALCMEGHGVNANLRYIESGSTSWKDIAVSPDYPLIQSIHADPDAERLFAGARKDSREKAMYAILYLDDSDRFQTLKEETEIFSGAVCRDNIYYLSTIGDGISRVSKSDIAQNNINENTVKRLTDASDINADERSDSRVFVGMIKLGNAAVIAVERNGGTLYEVGEGSFKKIKYSGGDKAGEWIETGKYATGALALWENYMEPQEKLLIAGIQGGLYSTTTSSYTHGFVEFELNSEDGSLKTNAPRHDSGNLKSIIGDLDQDRYTATIGKHPVNYLFQAPAGVDGAMTFFASTQTAGLWSYRDRPDNGGWQWNAEE
ncbi:MAG: hypothetical protein LBG95_10065 [Treponema sp.]|nr:hypothetical protein [Treponema sp.]